MQCFYHEVTLSCIMTEHCFRKRKSESGTAIMLLPVFAVAVARTNPVVATR